MYRLVAVDLDGTLLNSEKRISEEDKRVIKQAIDKGVKVVVCSGRIYAGARIFARQLGIGEPLIACNGAIIRDMATEELLYSDSMENEDCYRAMDICRKEGIYFHIYVGDTMYTERLDFSSLFYWQKNQTLPEKDRVDIRLVESTSEVLRNSRVAASKIVAVSDDPELLGQTREKVEKIETVEVMSSASNNFEIMNRGVSKGNALRFLSERLGIGKEEIVAIGDNENDYSMIQFAGLGIAMQNAEASVKEIADYITLSNNESGVAEAIRRFIL